MSDNISGLGSGPDVRFQSFKLVVLEDLGPCPTSCAWIKASLATFKALPAATKALKNGTIHQEGNQHPSAPDFHHEIMEIWVFPKMVVPQIIHFNRVFHVFTIHFGVPLILGTPICFVFLGYRGEYVDPWWWLNQPIWKISSSNWTISPGFQVTLKNVWKHQLDFNIVHLKISPWKRIDFLFETIIFTGLCEIFRGVPTKLILNEPKTTQKIPPVFLSNKLFFCVEISKENVPEISTKPTKQTNKQTKRETEKFHPFLSPVTPPLCQKLISPRHTSVLSCNFGSPDGRLTGEGVG